MPNFIANNFKQDILIALNLEDQLQLGTVEYVLHYLIEHKLDLSIFYPRYKNENEGRPAYHPAVLLKIILFAYSKGITSSREIQWCCKHNLIFKASLVIVSHTSPPLPTLSAASLVTLKSFLNRYY